VARPETISCEVCGVVVPVAPRGRVPRFCADHTAADLDQRTDSEREADEQAELARQQIAEAEAAAAAVADDGWPRQVAPVVWVGPNGERWTDLGEAERAVAAWRSER